ncbi:unnamed protein product, partial [Tetraodon nigroviridis]
MKKKSARPNKRSSGSKVSWSPPHTGKQVCRDLLQLPTRKEDGAAGGTHQEPTLGDQRGHPEPPIKEEHHDLWASEQEGNGCHPFCPQQPVCWEKHEEDPQAEGHHQTHGELRDVPVASTSGVQDGAGKERGAVTFTEPPPRDEPSFSTCGEAAEVVQFCSAASDFHCHLCDKPFSSNQFLINHAFRFHSRSADVLCAVCGKTLESTENLIAHINSHQGPKCCQVCGKHCRSSSSLKEHVAGHAGLKLHCCPLCGKECGRKGDLKIHMRIHTGEKPFCCSLCCKSFTHSGHLKKHLRSHTGERPHRCSVCGKRFLQSTHLKSHLGTHTH